MHVAELAHGFATKGIPTQMERPGLLSTPEACLPIIYSSSMQDLATERAASWLSKHFTYWWLEKQGHGRVLIDSDGL